MASHTITFHFFNNSNLGSLAVKARLGSYFSHVGVEFENGDFYHSTFLRGNVVETVAEQKQPPVYSTQIRVEEDRYLKALSVAKQAVGQNYDYRAIWGFLVGKPIQDDGSLFCSELGRLIFEAATGIRVPHFTLVSPGQLRLMVDTYIWSQHVAAP